MDLIDKLRALAAAIPRQLEFIKTEEATKHALVMPFIQALGYNVFDPSEVSPELTADVGTKKGEKVDYAILKDGKPTIIFECKWAGAELDNEHASQLFRYFSVTEARFGVLTNGIAYRFFTDLDETNKMDRKPFFEISLLSFTEAQVDELKRFTKSGFVLEQAVSAAIELKYTKEVKRIIGDELVSPSEELVRFFTAKVYSGRLTQAVRQQFTELVRRAFQQFISERISDRLKTAMEAETAKTEAKPADAVTAPPKADDQVVTTEDEREAFLIVRAIVRDLVDVSRIAMRDAKTYCAVLFDDNNRKPICRLWFHGSKRCISFFDEQRQEERLQLGDLNEIFKHADRIRAAVSRYLTPQVQAAAADQ